MKPSTHRYVLAPVLLGIHAVLLLPLMFSPATLQPPHFPGSSGHPWPKCGPDPKYQGPKPKRGRLYLQYSIPLGIVGIVGVYLSKQLAGNIPLPKDPRRKRLAQILEGSILFGIGVLEEVWRWGLVRLLVRFMGGHGGYRGTMEYLGKASGGGCADVEGILKEAVGLLEISPELPRPWEGLYLMGWVWSMIECLYSWYGVRPIQSDCTRQHTQTSPISTSKRIQAHFRRNSEGPTLTSHRPTLGKRARSDSVMGANEYDSRETRSILNSFGRKRRELSAVKPSETEDRSTQFVDITTAAESESSRTAYDESIRPANSSLFTGKTIKVDLETGLLSRLNKIRREQAEEQVDSDDGYGDDEESVSSDSDSDSDQSSIDSTRLESVTPLLSSSLPYDPIQQHPHHECQALLQNQRQQITYNTMASSLPLEPTDDNDDAVVTVHEYDHEDGSSDHRRDQTPKMQRSPVDRVYPSYPPYSSSYNHAHFTTSAAGQPSAGAISRPKHKMLNNSARVQRYSGKTVYGANINTLSPHLPVLWRTAALLRHISHALIYAWAPALVWRGHLQWVSSVVLFLLAAKKGWSTVEWFGGGASRTGLTKASIVSLLMAVIIYLVSLVLWEIIS